MISCIEGECWAGHKSNNDYMSLGRAEADKCLGDDYKPCGAFDRFCVGKQWSNMVYEIGEFLAYVDYLGFSLFWRYSLEEGPKR